MSARLRLTLSYAGFLLIAGVALMALLFYIIRFVPDGYIDPRGGFVPNRSDLLEALWPRTWQMLAILAIVGLVGGWFLAGRMLRPLQRINEVARRVAAGSLDRRVKLGGPNDEFRELADTFDSMLDRLQHSFDEQRRFAANASHELRTPYAIAKAMLDVAIADPHGQDVEQLVRRLDETNRRGIDVVEALLALASLDDGRQLERAPVDVAEIAAAVVTELRPLAVGAEVSLTTVLGEGDFDGSGTLVRQLVANLVLNGIRHNVGPGGSVELRTETAPDGSVDIRVVNTGPVISPELLRTLTEPFVRGAGRVSTRAADGRDADRGAARSAPEGSGLGLTLVARIAEVHGAELHLAAPETGGLDVRVRFPAPDIG